MTFDELEFTISQYLDGTLPPDQVAALEARLVSDSVARQLLEEYRQLDAVLRQAPAAPPLQWDRLAEHLSITVAGSAERNELLAIDYVDGGLPAAEAEEFARQIAEDGHARTLVEQHQKIRFALKSLPQPAVKWDRLSEHLYVTATGADRSFKLSAYRWMRIGGALAAAACVVLVMSLSLRQHQAGRPAPVAQSEAPQVAMIQIDGLDDAKPAGPVIAEISVGGAPDKQDPTGSQLADGIIVDSSPHSLVATNAPVAQDVQMPY